VHFPLYLESYPPPKKKKKKEKKNTHVWSRPSGHQKVLLYCESIGKAGGKGGGREGKKKKGRRRKKKDLYFQCYYSVVLDLPDVVRSTPADSEGGKRKAGGVQTSTISWGANLDPKDKTLLETAYSPTRKE